MLVVVMGIGDSRREQPNPMYFFSIDRCQYFAKKVPEQYGNYRHRYLIPPKDRITAYCKPVYVNPETIKPEIYR